MFLAFCPGCPVVPYSAVAKRTLAMASSTAPAGMDATATAQPQPIVRRFKTANDVSVPKSSPTVPRRSPGNPRQQSVQILDPQEVLEALNCPKPRGRINSFSPPYSSHSQMAAALILALTLGVFMAFRLPPAPSDFDFDALRLWTLSALICLPLLCWLLWVDPRARLPRKGVSVPTGRCKHGCVFEVAPKTRHCRKCDKCVAGFDHHCLWLNTCVGTENYRRWLVFMSVLCCWTMLGSWIAFSGLLRCRHLHSRRFAVGHRPAVALTCAMATLATAWLMLLLVLHAYFSFMGITTLEWATGAPGTPVQLQRCQRLPLTIVSMRCCVPNVAALAPAPGPTPARDPEQGAVSLVTSPETNVDSQVKQHWSKLRNAVLSEPSLSAPLSYNFRRRLSLSSLAVEETSESEGEPTMAGHFTPRRQHSA